MNSAALELLDHLAVSRAIEARQALDPAGATGESVDTPESAVPLARQSASAERTASTARGPVERAGVRQTTRSVAAGGIA